VMPHLLADNFLKRATDDSPAQFSKRAKSELLRWQKFLIRHRFGFEFVESGDETKARHRYKSSSRCHHFRDLRRITVHRMRETQPLVNAPAQDTIPGAGSGDS